MNNDSTTYANKTIMNLHGETPAFESEIWTKVPQTQSHYYSWPLVHMTQVALMRKLLGQIKVTEQIWLAIKVDTGTKTSDPNYALVSFKKSSCENSKLGLLN